VGAGAIFKVRGRLRGEWVIGSVGIWAVDKAASADTDYHGNFNAELFEKWFRKLCETARIDCGECRFILDGAKYHKRVEDPAPCQSKSKSEHFGWLVRQGVPAAMQMKKKELIELVSAHRPETKHVICEIAKEFGHEILFTPPYHPELQPIELIWAAIKNPIAMDPASSMAELEVNVRRGVEAINSDQWVAAYRHVQSVEEEYLDKMDTL
jgi:hypothetical protein